MLVVLREFPTQVFGSIEHEVEHLSIKWVHFVKLSRLVRFSKKPVEHTARICLGRDGLRRRPEAAVRVISFVQPLLILLMRLWHRGQLQ